MEPQFTGSITGAGQLKRKRVGPRAFALSGPETKLRALPDLVAMVEVEPFLVDSLSSGMSESSPHSTICLMTFLWL
jgi:hypothetical protein